MINPNELRLGNETNLGKVSMISDKMVFVIDPITKERKIHNIKNLEPIPITAEELIKIGCKVTPIYKGFSNDVACYEAELRIGKNVYFIDWNKYVVSDDNRWGFWTADIGTQKKHDRCIATVYYIHQIQNLWFDLNNEELQYKEESNPIVPKIVVCPSQDSIENVAKEFINLYGEAGNKIILIDVAEAVEKGLPLREAQESFENKIPHNIYICTGADELIPEDYKLSIKGAFDIDKFVEEELRKEEVPFTIGGVELKELTTDFLLEERNKALNEVSQLSTKELENGTTHKDYINVLEKEIKSREGEGIEQK